MSAGGPSLPGQTVVVIGGSAGIGLETARLARAEGAEVVLTARDAGRLQGAADEIGARGAAPFDAADPDALAAFFDALPHPSTTSWSPPAGRTTRRWPSSTSKRRSARPTSTSGSPCASPATRGSASGPAARCSSWAGRAGAARGIGLSAIGAATAALPALVANLALEVAPIRVNLIAPGFVDTPLSAALLGDDLEARREQLRSTLPIGRVVGPADVAALAVHLMVNTALTGATYDIDGGQQLVH